MYQARRIGDKNTRKRQFNILYRGYSGFIHLPIFERVTGTENLISIRHFLTVEKKEDEKEEEQKLNH